MAKYTLSHKEIMQRLISLIKGSKLDSGDGLIIPHINVAIVVEDWGSRNSDKFSMFHYGSNGADRFFLSNTFIPADNPYPADYVAMMCLPTLIETYYGKYVDDVDDQDRCIAYWNRILADNNAEASFKPKK